MASERRQPKTLEEIEAGLAGKTRKRIAKRRVEAEAHLARGDGHAAVNWALLGLQGELAKVREFRPGDAPAIDADIARTILRLTAQLPTYIPASRNGGAP